MAEQLAAVSALLGQQLEAEGWGQEGAAAAVAAVTVPGQLEPLLQVCYMMCLTLAAAVAAVLWDGALAHRKSLQRLIVVLACVLG